MAKAEKKSKSKEKPQSELSFGAKIGRVLALLLPLLAVILFGARLYFRLPVTSYYDASEKGFAIPGLSDNFVPQGLSFDKASDTFFVTGYQNDHTASPIYLVPRSGDSKTVKVLLQAPDGSDFVSHAGGLCVLGDKVYVAGGEDACVYVYDRSAILQARDGGSIPCLQKLDTFFGAGSSRDGILVAFVTADNGKLTVGEFYRDPNYPTPDSHKFTTPAKEYHQALAVTYNLSDEGALVPVEAYTLPDLVQGMTFHQGKIWLSTSYALAFSQVYAYERSGLKSFGTLPAGEDEIPLYALDSDALSAQYKLPPMAEEIEFADGRMYTMCESASNKYIFGKLTGGAWCYATAMEDMQNALDKQD